MGRMGGEARDPVKGQCRSLLRAGEDLGTGEEGMRHSLSTSFLPPLEEHLSHYVFLTCLVTRSSLCNSMDCSLPGFSVQRISQARILKWVTISFSR